MASVTLEKIYKYYPGSEDPAVIGVDLEIKDKEFVVLVGPSGCGKSTTLRMVAGLEEISKGTIRIGERIVNDVPPKDRDIAMVFQNYALYPHMTVYKNMAFGLKLRRFSKDEIEKRVMEAARMLSIEDYLDRKPKQLSGGQRQRVAVGRAIVRQPQVFLFDEPLSNLDAKLRVQMRNEIGKLHAKLQTTMIYVTHDQVEAMTMGDRIVVMKDGVIQQVDDPITLYDNPRNKFVAGFIGSPPMNFLNGGIEEEDGKLFFNEQNVRVEISGKKAQALRNLGGDIDRTKMTMGIRPEDFYDPDFVRAREGDQLVPFTAEVEIVEPMGAESYLYLTTGKSPIVARVDAHVKAELGQKKDLVVNIEKAHFFKDGELGDRVA
ncbi:MAG: sn-glycerol-3-phosphate ABC transporter ATP-binding protein UgpC [Candidatus Sumerlaeia bacterium]|nr:sn-glycerol-3-phosphate ABC transporter ATP-binding protein UgpC [Candidatus Sumerlaeia bacterium]